jgi:26S proteasome non-ATPase regulatory subunit 10
LTGDAAIALLKAGAETDKKDVDGFLALELTPGTDVCARYPYFTLMVVDYNRTTGPEIHRAEGRGGGDPVVGDAGWDVNSRLVDKWKLAQPG